MSTPITAKGLKTINNEDVFLEQQVIVVEKVIERVNETTGETESVKEAVKLGSDDFNLNDKADITYVDDEIDKLGDALNVRMDGLEADMKAGDKNVIKGTSSSEVKATINNDLLIYLGYTDREDTTEITASGLFFDRSLPISSSLDAKALRFAGWDPGSSKTRYTNASFESGFMSSINGLVSPKVTLSKHDDEIDGYAIFDTDGLFVKSSDTLLDDVHTASIDLRFKRDLEAPKLVLTNPNRSEKKQSSASLDANLDGSASLTLKSDKMDEFGNAVIAGTSIRITNDGVIQFSNGNGVSNITLPSPSGDTAELSDEIATRKAIIDLIYPVKSVFISFDSTSPALTLGGTWEELEGSYLGNLTVKDSIFRNAAGTYYMWRRVE